MTDNASQSGKPPRRARVCLYDDFSMKGRAKGEHLLENLFAFFSEAKDWLMKSARKTDIVGAQHAAPLIAISQTFPHSKS